MDTRTRAVKISARSSGLGEHQRHNTLRTVTYFLNLWLHSSQKGHTNVMNTAEHTMTTAPAMDCDPTRRRTAKLKSHENTVLPRTDTFCQEERGWGVGQCGTNQRVSTVRTPVGRVVRVVRWGGQSNEKHQHTLWKPYPQGMSQDRKQRKQLEREEHQRKHFQIRTQSRAKQHTSEDCCVQRGGCLESTRHIYTHIHTRTQAVRRRDIKAQQHTR
jgi:hypothetical protein